MEALVNTAIKTKPGQLLLEDGTSFQGFTPEGFPSFISGEVVFTTAMSGYVQTLTDPSYSGQIVVFTYPLIGNYGVPSKDLWEGAKCYPKGVVLSQPIPTSAHFEQECSLVDFLKVHGVALIHDVDTRAVTKRLREKGVCLGGITPRNESLDSFYNPNDTHLVAEVSTKEKKLFGKGNKRIVLVDCGAKSNILRSLLEYPVEVLQVPFNSDFASEDADGFLLSNGPGDPEQCLEVMSSLKKVLEQERPTFGICLGSQLLALAIGAKTYKLKYGHRGINQACYDKIEKRCFLTSQNHGYAVDERTLPEEWEVYFENLHDGSCEGIYHKTKPFFGVQFHPESSPGPRDTRFLFEKFMRLCQEGK